MRASRSAVSSALHFMMACWESYICVHVIASEFVMIEVYLVSMSYFEQGELTSTLFLKVKKAEDKSTSIASLGASGALISRILSQLLLRILPLLTERREGWGVIQPNVDYQS